MPIKSEEAAKSTIKFSITLLGAFIGAAGFFLTFSKTFTENGVDDGRIQEKISAVERAVDKNAQSIDKLKTKTNKNSNELFFFNRDLQELKRQIENLQNSNNK